MKIISKEVKNNDGTVDRIIARSDDNYRVNVSNNYTLANCYSTRKTFKDSIFGTDIGIHSYGFASIAIISTIIAIGVFVGLLLSFRI